MKSTGVDSKINEGSAPFITGQHLQADVSTKGAFVDVMSDTSAFFSKRQRQKECIS